MSGQQNIALVRGLDGAGCDAARLDVSPGNARRHDGTSRAGQFQNTGVVPPRAISAARGQSSPVEAARQPHAALDFSPADGRTPLKCQGRLLQSEAGTSGFHSPRNALEVRHQNAKSEVGCNRTSPEFRSSSSSLHAVETSQQPFPRALPVALSSASVLPSLVGVRSSLFVALKRAEQIPQDQPEICVCGFHVVSSSAATPSVEAFT